MPDPYRVFYNSLNFASTYLLVGCVLCGVAIFLGLLYYCWGKQNHKGRLLWSLWEWLFGFAYGGLAVASFSCLMNVFINEQTGMTVNAVCYILGVLVYLSLLGEALYLVMAGSK